VRAVRAVTRSRTAVQAPPVALARTVRWAAVVAVELAAVVVVLV
jgi:hypothetical protein